MKTEFKVVTSWLGSDNNIHIFTGRGETPREAFEAAEENIEIAECNVDFPLILFACVKTDVKEIKEHKKWN